MHWIYLFLPLWLVAQVLSVKLADKPPTISKVSVATGDPNSLRKLEKPQDYVILGSNSNSPRVKNRLLCKATNADVIYWEFKALETDEWSTVMPSVIIQETEIPAGDGLTVTRELNDGQIFRLEDLGKLNGYYRCNAESSDYGYKTRSPPIRIILPYLKNSVRQPKQIPGNPVNKRPFSIPCYDDVANQIVPEDAAKFTKITYNWEFLRGNENLDFPDHVAIKPSRFSIDPLTVDSMGGSSIGANGAFAPTAKKGDKRLYIGPGVLVVVLYLQLTDEYSYLQQARVSILLLLFPLLVVVAALARV